MKRADLLNLIVELNIDKDKVTDPAKNFLKKAFVNLLVNK